MNLLKFLHIFFIATYWCKSENRPKFVKQIDISCCAITSSNQDVFSSVAFMARHIGFKKSTSHLIGLLLLLSGQIEINSGPTTKYPCGECSKAVRWGQNGIACDSCNQWFHTRCIDLSPQIYDVLANGSDMEWECCNCGIKNISVSLFDTPLNSSVESNTTLDSSTTTITPKHLKILCINFQSIMGKKDQVAQALQENGFDVVI